MATHVKQNDMVEVIAGDHRGARGKVLRVDAQKQKVVVEGINLVFRHVRPTRKNPQGGRLQKEAPIHLSNVLPIDPKKGKGTRVHMRVEFASAGHIASKKRVGTGGTVLSELTRSHGKR